VHTPRAMEEALREAVATRYHGLAPGNSTYCLGYKDLAGRMLVVLFTALVTVRLSLVTVRLSVN
jgi:hypothetical protein